jgi:hypothetical protein
MRACVVCDKIKKINLFPVDCNICLCCKNKKRCLYCNVLKNKSKFRYARNKCIKCEYTTRTETTIKPKKKKILKKVISNKPIYKKYDKDIDIPLTIFCSY